jgi:hypothetical protein
MPMNSTIRTRSVGYPLEIGEHEDVEQLGAGSGAEGVETGTESAVEFIASHRRRLRRTILRARPCTFSSRDWGHAPRLGRRLKRA